ncbi:MAG: PilZ domain-containing protein [Methylomonas sp.]|nr:PilZ domain-containing protein [Methylomonas sp.]
MSKESVDEKRRFQRIFYRAEASLLGDGLTLPCRIVDISLKGCLLEFGQSLAETAGGLYALALKLSEEVTIGMKLRLVHRAGALAGFECVYIDIDSMTNLRRLVELNLGDSELLGRDLNALSDR